MPRKKDVVLKGGEIKGAIADLYRYCFFFKQDGLCHCFDAVPEKCTGEQNGSICPQFISFSKLVCDKYKIKTKPVRWHDTVDWDNFSNDTRISTQKTLRLDND